MMCLFLPYNKWISYIHTYMHTCIHTYPPSRVSLHLIHPILLGCRKSHRAPSWVPCAKERLPTGYLFYTWQCIGWRRQWRSTPVLLPGKSHGRGSLVGCSPWGLKESDTTEWLHFHFSLSCIGEGNGDPLQCSCLENPRDGGAWWAAVYGVTQSQTRLKRRSRSSVLVVYQYCTILIPLGRACSPVSSHLTVNI